MSGPTQFNEHHFTCAGLAMNIFRGMPGHTDAQISMAFMAAYLCSQYEIDPGTFCHVLLNNVQQVGGDPKLMNQVVERIHRISTMPRLAS